MAYNACDCSGTEINPSGNETSENCMVNMVRALIGDWDFNYSNERLEQLLGAATFYVVNDLSCCQSVCKPASVTCGVLPDDVLDYPSFAHLVALKASCLIDQSTIREKAAIDGIRAVCGPASVSVSSSSSLKTLIDSGPCAAYEQTKEDLCFRCPIQSAVCCAQIMDAFVSWDFRGSYCGRC